MVSLPPRERGLKSSLGTALANVVNVAPSAGAWIEILNASINNAKDSVAPSAGAWIEILISVKTLLTITSLPPRERGLKFFGTRRFPLHLCRSLRGSVD